MLSVFLLRRAAHRHNVSKRATFGTFPKSATLNSAQSADILKSAASAIESNPSLAKELTRAIDPKSLEAMSAIVIEVEKNNVTAPRPNTRQLFLVGLNTCVPFIAFGFIDNFMMIIAGEYIDVTFGALLGISTLAAAGLGNAVSDVAGVSLGGVVETYAKSLGIPVAQLSRSQMELGITRVCLYLGSAIGVTVGCLLGMVPLLFMDIPKKEPVTVMEDELEGLSKAVAEEARRLVECEAVTLLLLDEDQRQLSPSGGGGEEGGSVSVRVGEGVVGRVAATGVLENALLPQGGGSNSSSSNSTSTTLGRVHSMLCVPVLRADGKVAAVLQLVNKRGGGGETVGGGGRKGGGGSGGFDAADVAAAKLLACHTGVSLELLQREFEEESSRMTHAEKLRLVGAHSQAGSTADPNTPPIS